MSKFFASVFALAVIFASCTNEKTGTDPDPDPTPDEITGSTYATFKFNRADQGRAAFDPTMVTADDTKDAAWAVSDLRLVIFNATSGACEYNSVVSSNDDLTILLSAGQKKIFVFANTGKLNDAGGSNSPSDFNTKIGAFTVNGAKTLADFNLLTFDAGTPQHYLTDAERTGAETTPGRTFKYDALYTRVNDPTLGLPASNDNSITYTLVSGVTKTDAMAETPSNTGTSPKNSFNIQLNYMAAKARMAIGSDVRNQAATRAENKAAIGDIFYTVKNLAKDSYYTQHKEGNEVKSTYYQKFSAGAVQSVFDPFMDYASAATVTAPLEPGTNSYIFLPENNDANNNVLRGQSSFFAMKVDYQPADVIKAVDWIPGVPGKVDAPTATLSSIGVVGSEGALDYIYVRENVIHSSVQIVHATMCFKNIDLLIKYAWLKVNGASTTWTGTPTQVDEGKTILGGDAAIADLVYSFKGATSWYRIDVGIGNGAQTDYGVIRGNAYTANISGINGPGVPNESDLITDPGKYVKEETYVSVTIVAASWKPVSWTGAVQ